MSLTTRQSGTVGENVAEQYLTANGYRILGRNLGCRYGEIDMVAQQGDKLFFVEIKRRRTRTFGQALEAVPLKKQHRIRRTAEYLLLKNCDWAKMVPFFSVLAIDEDDNGDMKIEFLKDAFQ